MKKILIVTALIVFSNTLYSQGFTWDERSESHHKTFDKVGLSRSAVVPSSFSLEKYLPHTMNQGASDMCAAYSLATCRTILYARNNDLTDIDKISAEAYSPYYIYYKFKHVMGEGWPGGMSSYTDRINEFGYAKMKDIEYPYYYPFTNHNLWNFSLPSYVDLDIETVKEDKFDNIYSIYASKDASDPVEEVITQMKTELSKEHPIKFGFGPLPASFNSVGNNDYWSDTMRVRCQAYEKDQWKGKWLADEKCYTLTNNPYALCDNHRPSDYLEAMGHAMIVIGYDDAKYGGSFQILNSWGSDWGDNGKVWVPYKDFVKYAHGIQSFDKEKKSIFDTKKSSSKKRKKLNAPDMEVGLETKDFSSYISFDWIMFAQMTIEGGEYKGKKDQGLKNGRGMYTLPNGIKYEGNWENDKMHGEGRLTYQSMYEYNGEFKDGSFHGEGILTRYDGFGHIIGKSDGIFENGEFIEGYLIKDIDRGFWTGCRYEGNFEDAHINGNGLMISYEDGTEYEGTFSYGYCDGKGIIKISEGQYEGEWIYCVPYGRGTWKGKDGSIESGVWDGWKIVKE